MNDPLIRQAFHCSFLKKEHAAPNTLVVDELGLVHGKCRADIAVINGHFVGYEIKSGKDSLVRLQKQVEVYNAIFDLSFVVLEKRHLIKALNSVPTWWGVILVIEEKGQLIGFETVREPIENTLIDDYAVAQLLWRDEAQEILLNLGVKGKQVRECRANLYQHIIDIVDSRTLRDLVREYLKKRKDWRHPELPSLYDDSSLPLSM